MKVCMVAYAFYESDTRVMRYAEALARRGDRVDIVALRRDEQSSHEALNGINVFRVQTRPPNEGAKGSYLLEILMFLLRATVLITRRHLRQPYEVIHVHSVPDFLVFAALVPKLTGAKVILDIHDLLPEFYASKFGAKEDSLIFRLLAFTERVSAAFADHVIAANDIWRERLVSRSLKNGKCTSMVNFPDRGIFSPRGRTRTDRKFVILYPGTLNWHQGLDIAILAFSRIRDEAPEVEFHIHGEGPAQRSLLKMINDL